MEYSIQSMFEIKGQVAILVGATGGMGTEIAVALNALGVKLVLVGRSLDRLQALQSRLRAHKGEVTSLPADITDKASVEEMARRTVEAYGRIDILINCAGLSHLEGAADFNEDMWDHLLKVNLKGTFLTCQAVGRHMLEQKSGRIINFSSVRGHQGRAQDLAYAPSKGAVNQLTKSLAIEWAQSGINVNAIAPTFTRTELNRCLLADDATQDWVLKRIPKGRLGQPEDIIGALVFLCAPASAFVTGHVLLVDGGWTAA